MASASTSTCTAETQTDSRKSYKRLPPCLMELLEIAIFSFASISGLRSTDKVRGDPILKGVCAMFAQLLSCASPETTEALRATTESRLGNWTPDSEPTAELLTLVSSKLKTMKAEGQLSETKPSAPMALFEKCERLDETTERVVTRLFPCCWRCKRRCRFCRLKKAFIPYGFRTELLSPLLDVLDDQGEKHNNCDTSDEAGELPDQHSDVSEEETIALMEQFTSGDLFSDEDVEEDVEELSGELYSDEDVVE